MPPPPPPIALSPPVIAHIVLAVVTWAILAPLPHLLAPLSRLANQPHRAFLHHRLLMLLTLLSTLLLTLLALFFSDSHVPPTHRYLALLLLLLTSFQATLGALRPPKTHPYRHQWRFAHRLLGASVLLVGAWIVHHAFDVFRLSRRAKLAVDVILCVMYAAVLVAHVVALFTLQQVAQETVDDARGGLLGDAPLTPHELRSHAGDEADAQPPPCVDVH